MYWEVFLWQSKKKPISKGLKTFFGVGDLGFNWMTNIETYYYAYFLTNIAQFPLALVTVTRPSEVLSTLLYRGPTELC